MTLEQILGAAVMLLFLADIFLTVLYARAGTGLLAPAWNRAVWALISAIAVPFGRRRTAILSFAGPIIVVLLIGLWALGLTVGAALVIHPELGTAIRPSSGSVSTDFVTALLVAGNSLSVVGSGDYAPHTSGTRLLFLLNSFIGASVLSLVLSYLVQVYSALRERNALAFNIDLMTGGTGDAAEMLARLGPDGDFGEATSELGNLARTLAATKEAHHFYPLLFYFRFREPLYSVPRFSFILLDLTTLIDTALDTGKHGTFVRSAPVGSLRRGALILLETLDRHFRTVDAPFPTAARTQSSAGRYAKALDTLRQAGVEAHPDDASYADRRNRWEPLVLRVGLALGDEIDEIDRRPPQDEAMLASSAGVPTGRGLDPSTRHSPQHHSG